MMLESDPTVFTHDARLVITQRQRFCVVLNLLNLCFPTCLVVVLHVVAPLPRLLLGIRMLTTLLHIRRDSDLIVSLTLGLCRWEAHGI